MSKSPSESCYHTSLLFHLTDARDDVVTLQNPHGLPALSTNKAPEKATAPTKKEVALEKTAPAVAKAQKSEACEWQLT
jgi:hypothetical protein